LSLATVSTAAIIPARYASTRLPGKMLLDRTGKPLVVHVAEQAARARCVQQVLVATDDRRIFQAVEAHGHRAVMTRPDHPNGTSRIAEAAAALGSEFDIIVNVQGDEPMIDPEVVDACVERLGRGDAPMATVASPFAAGEDPADPNIVKVVLDRRGRALYFSRAVIPHVRDAQAPDAVSRPHLKHIGLYAYRRDFLPVYIGLAPTPAEEAEKLEQLRALEHGHPIAVTIATVHHHGIDTLQQYEAFVARYGRKS
jgi:3-deoxy-manno-octulosonate cytidylyltransferase (CMP-KDO synthetase)